MSAIIDRLGCSTITLRQLPLDKALDTIVAAGLHKADIACIPGFCPHIDPLGISHQEELGIMRHIRSRGLTISTLNISAGGLNTDRRSFVFQFIEAAISLAHRLGCYAITIPTGAKAPDASLWEENARRSAEAIRQLADRASEAGIQLTLEAPHTGTLAENMADTRRFYAVLDDPRVGNTFDTSHVAKGNPLPVADCLAEMGATVGHVHFRDCIGENNHLTPGKGKIEFRPVLQRLESLGYTRDFAIELEGEDSQQAAAELAYAIQYIGSLDV